MTDTPKHWGCYLRYLDEVFAEKAKNYLKEYKEFHVMLGEGWNLEFGKSMPKRIEPTLIGYFTWDVKVRSTWDGCTCEKAAN